MDCKEELLIFAKTGAVFANCDGEFVKKEGDSLKKYIEKHFKKSIKEVEFDIEKEIDEFRKQEKDYVNNELFNQVISETKEYLDSKKKYDDEKKKFLIKLEKFIYKIITADKDKRPEELELYHKWRLDLYKYIGLKEDDFPPEASFYTIKKVLWWIIVGIIAAIITIITVGLISNKKHKTELEAFPLSSYTEKILQFKEIDFSKVLIYGTETESSERDSLLLYFVKGTAVLRFRGLDNLNVNSKASTKDTLVLNYDMSNQTELPIDVEIIYDESKCRFIDSIEATTLKNSSIGKTIKGISTVAGTIGGGYLGNTIGGLFGLKGQIIGLASGAAIGGVGGYIASANFVKNTKMVKDNSAATIRDMLEEAKPVIAAQLLQDETVTRNTDKNEFDLNSISKYYQQQLADILTNIICNDENNKWQNVEISFNRTGK